MIDNTVDHVNNDGRTPQECVDRNNLFYGGHLKTTCRTPQECVDRNNEVTGGIVACEPGRTPQECVDRNGTLKDHLKTPSSRTPQECVDRNWFETDTIADLLGVALHRSAWIEIADFWLCIRFYPSSHSTGVRG